VLYGATGGSVFIAGRAGERFAVRNSGAVAVVEGVGDHGCEYMTGGLVINLGPLGQNFAAGMSGGIAYLLDSAAAATNVNPQMVRVEPLDADDEACLRGWLTHHHALTGSPRAAALLNNWAAHSERFVRVVPKEGAMPPRPIPVELPAAAYATVSV
jgi:glutamate synthase (NADPH) large chain